MSPPDPAGRQSPPVDTATARARIWAPALAAAVAVLCFARTVGFGFVNWDDGVFVYDNPLVLDPTSQPLVDRLATPGVGYPVPATIAVFGWLWRLGSGDAWPYHLVNVLLHGAVVLGACRLLERRLRTVLVAPDRRAAVVAVAGLAMATHPVLVEPVTWVTGLKDLLLAAGSVGMLLALEPSRARADEASEWRHAATTSSPWMLAAAAVGALLGLTAKPTGVVVGPIALAFIALPVRCAANTPDEAHDGHEPLASRLRPRRGAVSLALLLTGVGVAWALWTAGQETEALRTRADAPWSPMRPIGAVGLSVRHLLAPATLSPIYGFDEVGALEIALAVAALAGLAVLGWRVVAARPWLVAAGLAWLPVANLVPLERFTADSYLYLPWIFLVGGLATAIAGPLARADAPPRLARLAPALPLTWMLVAVAQQGIWRSDLTLWRAAVTARPRDPALIVRYGDVLGRSGAAREELALYLEHLDALEEAEVIPVALPVYFARSGAPERARRWFALALHRPVAQPDGTYVHYAEFVAEHPDMHAPELDAALAHALPLLRASPRWSKLPPEARAHLEAEARRLAAPDAGQAPAPAVRSSDETP